MEIIERLSPNQNERPAGTRISLVVMHGTVGSDQGDLDWLLNPRSQVSYHYLVWRNGQIFRMVNVGRRAWHAGLSTWQGRGNVNDYSIGIGLSNRGPRQDGPGFEPYTDAQYASAAFLGRIFMREFGLGLRDFVGHHHVSGAHLGVRRDAKTDPWEYFEWGRFFQEMLSAP